MPNLGAPLVDPQSGLLTKAWSDFFVALFLRTGEVLGVSATELQTMVQQASAAGNTTQVLQLGDLDIGPAAAGLQLGLALDLPPQPAPPPAAIFIAGLDI